jgi:hypothetical protein
MIGEKTKGVVNAIASHPKTSGAVAVVVNEVNLRFADYEPIAKMISSGLGMVLVTLLIIKASIDIYKSINDKS